MIYHSQISDFSLRRKIRQRELRFAGNRKLKIYGTLQCSSGKRMKSENRVFFSHEREAAKEGYRPCRHCMGEEYKRWKMDLFNDIPDKRRNLLPKDGAVNYYGK